MKLVGVELSQNRIKAIQKQNSLFFLPKLEYVNINNNPINRYEAGSFDSASRKDLLLNFNMIEIVDGNYSEIDFFDLKRVEILFFIKSVSNTKFYQSTLVKDILNINNCELLFSFYSAFSFILFNI